LCNHYKKLFQLKKSNPALADGVYTGVTNDNDKVFSFLRSKGDHKVLVVVNLSEQKQNVTLNQGDIKSMEGLWKKETITPKDGKLKLELQPYAIQVFRLH
jgi:glycosidase